MKSIVSSKCSYLIFFFTVSSLSVNGYKCKWNSEKNVSQLTIADKKRGVGLKHIFSWLENKGYLFLVKIKGYFLCLMVLLKIPSPDTLIQEESGKLGRSKPHASNMNNRNRARRKLALSHRAYLESL